MEEKFNEATPQRPQGRTIDASSVTINLLSFIEQIRSEDAWKDSDRNAITVFKTNGMCIVLIALHKGAQMIKHVVDGLMSVQVLVGEMLFTTDEQSIDLSKGEMLALHEGVPHSVIAKVETIFLMTITTSLEEK
jgi:quercetin dioxygenase-like cupin family protein